MTPTTLSSGWGQPCSMTRNGSWTVGRLHRPSRPGGPRRDPERANFRTHPPHYPTLIRTGSKVPHRTGFADGWIERAQNAMTQIVEPDVNWWSSPPWSPCVLRRNEVPISPDPPASRRRLRAPDLMNESPGHSTILASPPMSSHARESGQTPDAIEDPSGESNAQPLRATWSR